ncbi:MAG: DUF1295 domain-containing protein [Spirochaetales bacterium]|nr:DUF1295 domain-containing protein [Spirochaetales bacterium]
MILSLWLWGGVGVTGLMLLGFFIGQVRRDNSLVDILWGLAQVAGIVSALVWLGFFPKDPIFWVWGTTVFLWALRLSGHIGYRNAGKGEDPRYQGFRKSWGSHQILGALFQVYLLQGILAMIIFVTHGVAIWGGATGSRGPGAYLFFALGLILWIVGFVFESLGDYQLLRFKSRKDSKGKLMTTGVWSLTRHPNYFGEACLWWGWGVGILGFGLPYPGLLGLVGPAVVTFLLLGLSGVPMTEARYAGRIDFAEYAERTNRFFPGLPKRTGKNQ